MHQQTRLYEGKLTLIHGVKFHSTTVVKAKQDLEKRATMKKKQSNYERQDAPSVNSKPEILNLKTYCCLHSVSIKQASDVSHNTEAGNVCVL